MNERIAKVIARRTGIARRKAEILIAEGKVKIDGKLINHPSEKVFLGANITIDDKQIPKFKAPELWLFHKPPKYETTRNPGEGKSSIYDLLPENLHDLKYIGRLDYLSEGLLLLTNDGEIIDKLSRAKNKVEKVYRIHCQSKLSPDDLHDLFAGRMIIEGEEYTIEDFAIKSNKNEKYELEIVLTEGKNREIRNIFKHLNIRISRLIRIRFAEYRLGKLKPACYSRVPIK